MRFILEVLTCVLLSVLAHGQPAPDAPSPEIITQLSTEVQALARDVREAVV